MGKDLGPTIIVPWLVVDLTGQLCLLVFLVTLAVVKHLPQRRNPFLVNLILASFLATIPPALLFYANELFKTPSINLCFGQAALVDGVAPMFGVAQLVLVFDTWCELRNVSHKKRHISRGPMMKYMLIFAPYVAMWIWTFSSFVAAAQSHATRSSGFVYCTMSSPTSNSVHRYVGVFIVVVALIEVVLELWVGWMIYKYPAKIQNDATAWRTSYQFALRVIILSSITFIVVLLSLANNAINSQPLKLAYEMLNSMNALATFVAFATQKSVLKCWKFWGRRKTVDDPNELRPQAYPMLDWADVPLGQPRQVYRDSFDNEEKGKPQYGYITTWLGRKT